MSKASNWSFIPRSKYAAPGFATETIRSLHGGWKALRKKVVAWRKDSNRVHGDLERPVELPEGLLPEFDIEAAASSLDELLTDKSTLEAKRPRLRIVIGPPGTHVPQILSAVALGNGWPEVEAPRRGQLLTGSSEIKEHLDALHPGAETPVVVGRLESWFLRRERAMPVVRALIQALATGSGPVLAGCDSWTWAYLDRTIGIEGTLGEPLVLAPFDGAKLDHWLGASFRSSELVCMRSGSRDEIFSTTINDEEEQEQASKSSPRFHPLLGQLASTSRGNPSVALALWRRSLREGDLRAGQNEHTAAERARSWWAVPPEEAELELPADTDDIERFVLHASLLHGGLDEDLLLEGLPFPEHEVVRRVNRLASLGVLIEGEIGLTISRAAYLPTRRSLATRGFLVDGL